MAANPNPIGWLCEQTSDLQSPLKRPITAITGNVTVILKGTTFTAKTDGLFINRKTAENICG